MTREFIRGATLIFALLSLLLSFGCAKSPASYSSSDGKLRPVNPDNHYTPEQLKAGRHAR